jgi:hypothetical protein
MAKIRKEAPEVADAVRAGTVKTVADAERLAKTEPEKRAKALANPNKLASSGTTAKRRSSGNSGDKVHALVRQYRALSHADQKRFLAEIGAAPTDHATPTVEARDQNKAKAKPALAKANGCRRSSVQPAAIRRGLNTAIKRKKVSAAQVAKQAGVSDATISLFRSGKSDMTAENRTKVATALDRLIQRQAS